MVASTKWQKLLFAGLFCSGLVLVIAGFYLSQVTVDAPTPLTSENGNSEIPADTATPSTVEWCDAMMEKANADWQEDEFKRFSENCLNPEEEPASE